jgi:preprotein translocase subunit SecE
MFLAGMRKNNSSKAQSKPKPKPKSSAPSLVGGKPVAVAAGAENVATDAKSPVKRIGAAEFFRLTRAEIGRITWPTRKETTMTTVMVFVMVTILSLFFFLVDQILSYGIKVLLG